MRILWTKNKEITKIEITKSSHGRDSGVVKKRSLESSVLSILLKHMTVHDLWRYWKISTKKKGKEFMFVSAFISVYLELHTSIWSYDSECYQLLQLICFVFNAPRTAMHLQKSF